MTEFEQALIHRDHISKAEAKRQRSQAMQEFYEMMEEGCSYEDVEDMLECEFGLEMDYIFDIM